MFEPKTEQIVGGCRKLHNCIRKIKARISWWVGYVAGIGDQRKHIWNWIGECKGNRTFKRPI